MGGQTPSTGAPRRATRHATPRTPGVIVAAALAAAALATTGLVGTIGAAPAGAAVATKTTNTGTVTVQEPTVTMLRKGQSKFSTVKSKAKIKTGDTLQTGPTGFAQIAFPDGSVTRLDHNTVFTLDKLVTTTGERQVEGTVSAGQTWNRVQKLSDNESFDQGNGNGATAAVLGTAFVTKCEIPAGGAAFTTIKTKKALKKLKKATKSCNFTLIDGKLQLTARNKTLDVLRGQQVDSTGGDAADAESFAPDILFNDQWIVRNLGADASAGISEASGEPTAEDLAQARIEGAWPVTLVVTSGEGFRNLEPSRLRTYTFSGRCNGGTCQVTLSRETANGTHVIPLSYRNGVYSGEDTDLGVQDCLLDDGTVAVPGGLRNTGSITFSPTSAVARDGLWVATGLGGTVTETATQVAGPAGACVTGAATFALSASR